MLATRASSHAWAMKTDEVALVVAPPEAADHRETRQYLLLLLPARLGAELALELLVAPPGSNQIANGITDDLGNGFAFHVGDGGFVGRTRYFSTVDFATLMPSFRRSPTMRGELHVGFGRHISRISARTSCRIAGRPGFPCSLRRRQWS